MENIYFLKESSLQLIMPFLMTELYMIQNMPAWDITFYQGTLITADEGVLTGSNVPTQHIPQLHVKATYKTRVVDVNEVSPEDPYIDISELVAGYNPRFSSLFDDGTFVDAVPENLLIEILENNTDFEKANFDIEVFLVEEVEDPAIGSIERLKQLMFMKEQNNIINDILYDDAEIVPLAKEPVNPSYVEYYFDVFVDERIEEVEICRSVGRLKSRGYRIEAPIECPDSMTKVNHTIYRSDIGSEDVDNCQD
jgi:hypothetical protein